MLKKSIIKNLQSIVSEKDIHLKKESLNSFTVDGLMPEAALFPNSVEEVSAIMKLASKESLSAIPIGSGTKIALGNKPEKVDIVISTKNLNRIVEHAASDLVATTESGVSLKNFQAELNKENQFLALDPPHYNSGATIGGIIATNDSGPERLRYGTAREFLIGLKIVQADGSVFKGGSKVVKNVAGYDMPKLYVGSLGTLGIIVEATFRLYPVPEYSETYLASFPSLEKCHDAVMSLLSSDLVLTSLEILNPELSNSLAKINALDIEHNKYALAVGIRNVEKAVKDQMSTVLAICNQSGGKGDIIGGAKEEKLWEDIRDFPWELLKVGRVVCKAGVLVTDIPKVLDNIDELSDKNTLKTYVSTRAGSGICIIAMEGEDASILNTVKSLRNFVAELGGHLVIHEAPEVMKSEIDVWGDLGSGIAIMKRIKSNFDPGNLFNPGRYI